MQVTNVKFDGDLITECTYDGVPVVLIRKEWDVKTVFSALGKTGTGALIIEALVPGGLLVGAAVGLFSVFLENATGYYEVTTDGSTIKKRRVHLGELHRWDFTWS